MGFSNEEGGLVIYGVADTIKNASVSYPGYLTGLTAHPSIEDLSLWVKDRVYPLVVSPAIRFFEVEGRKIGILKIPSGVNKPYCYSEPDTRSLSFFKRIAGGVVELSPDEVREFHRTQIIEQSQAILRASKTEVVRPLVTASSPSVMSKHLARIPQELEDPKDFGIVRIYCWPAEPVSVPVPDLQNFLQQHRLDFSESMRYFRTIDVRQNFVSVGYFPNAVREDVKSTVRIALYTNGFAALDALADTFLSGDNELHSGWLCYELQRHLQLTKALLHGRDVFSINIEIDFAHISAIRLVLIMSRNSAQYAAYTGSHEPIKRRVLLQEIYDYNSDKRNIVMPVVRDIMEEVGRIFGLSKAPPNLWDSNGYLNYVRGVEGQR